MSRTSLSPRAWRLARAAPIPANAPLDDPARFNDWLPARVPGSIQRDLMAAGRLPDLRQRLHLDDALQWVDASDWWYHTDLPGIGPEQRAWIDFDGIDYMAAVTVAGRELERRAGAYSRRRYEITDRLRRGPAPLNVRIWGAWALPRWPRTPGYRLKRWLASRVQKNLPPFHDRLLTLKAPVHFGWDFSPRLMAAGIRDDVRLHISGHIAITDLWARADWGPGRGLMVHLHLDALLPAAVTIHLKLNDGQARAFPLTLPAGASSHILAWPDARLLPWTTHDRGQPHLYQLEASIRDHSDRVSDSHTVVIGSRAFGWRIENDVYHPRLNTIPIRFRGVNWVPLDLLPGDENEEARYRALLQQAVDAGVNALRVWGGGGRERPIFYDLCDELGLLVWQEMPIACVFLDHLPRDDAFVALVRRETAGIIRSLRQHPGIILWSGGNEWGPGRFPKIARAMSETASREDPSRRWLPASPGPNDSHNWQVWHGYASPQRYASDPAPLLSEFGLAAPPDADTLRRILPPGHIWPPGEAWQARKAELKKLTHYANLQDLRDLETLIAASQEAQARGLQIGIEAYRLRENAVGTFIWQWNEPWPAISWAVIPYQGPPKRAYRQIARSYAPLAPIARLLPDGIELWVVNDAPQSPGLCHLAVSLAGREQWAGDITPPALSRTLIHTLPLPETPGLLTLHLTGPGVDITNDYPLHHSFSPNAPMGLRARLQTKVLQWLLRW